MIIYNAYTGAEGGEHFATLKEAIAHARAAVAEGYVDYVEVERNVCVPLTKANLLNILNSNGGQWVVSREIVKTIKAK